MAIVKTRKLVRESRLLKQLFFHGNLTNAEISELEAKSIPLISHQLNDMVASGWIVNLGQARSTGGRRPQIYSIKKDAFYFIGVAMDQLITQLALFNAGNEVVGSIESHPLPLTNNPSAPEQLIQYIQNLIQQSGCSKKQILGIGIGMPGFVDSEKGINHTFLQVKESTLVSLLEEALKIPVVIENDSSLIALAELKWGAAKGKQHAMVVNIGWGVGLGIIANGGLFKGFDGFAGEFSHIPLFDNQKLCGCGKYGCLETETSLSVITQNAIEKERAGELSVVKDLAKQNLVHATMQILEAASQGDKFSIEVISASAYHIGRGIAILIHLLNPELIVISGIGSLAGKVWTAPIQQAINEHCIPKIAEHAEIKISELGKHVQLKGVAALVMEHFDRLRAKAEKMISDR